jgi:hypothetical protein
VAEWTSLLEATPASRSAPPESDSEKTIQDISGHSLQMELLQCDQVSVSLKTSRDISRWDCPTSSKTWQEWVTERRGEYSLRVKSAHLIRESEYLSWPTSNARDWKGTSPNYGTRKDGKSRADQLPVAVALEETSWPTPKVQEAGKIGNQPNHGQLALSNHPAIRGEEQREKYEKGNHGPVARVNPSTDGSRQEWLQISKLGGGKSWMTPRTQMTRDGNQRWEEQEETLGGKIKWIPAHSNIEEQMAVMEETKNAKLNPRWVETLMGLSVGWTLPSCIQPVIIAPTSCDCSEMELSRQQQSEPSELF